jgi:NTE family protein
MATTAFVLSGGGSLGAVQVGMLQALALSGVHPDLLVGTSAGAVNAAWVAGHGMSADSLDQLARVWAGMRRSDIFPVDPRQVVRGLTGRSMGITSDTRLRRLVGTHAGFTDLTHARVPTYLMAADLLSGDDVLISAGDIVDGVLASAAIPGLLPPVEHLGRYLVDGSVALNAGVAQAVDLGATVVYVLPTGAPCALTEPPRSAIGVALQSLTLLIAQRLIHEMSGLGGAVTIKVLPPLCPLAVSAADFGHAAELIARARRASLEWISSGDIDLPAPERFLALHDHGSTASSHGARPHGLVAIPRS